jgi:hypothetical protein
MGLGKLLSDVALLWPLYNNVYPAISGRIWSSRQAIRTSRAKLFFLPAYSPDLNPIQQVFAKPRPAPHRCRTSRRKPLGAASAHSSTPYPTENAPITSVTPATLQVKTIIL